MNNKRGAALPRPLGSVLQPIVDTDGGMRSVYAVECLTRGPLGSKYEGAAPLFEYVRARGLETQMDHACIAIALSNIAECSDCKIALNVHPTTLVDRKDFVQFLVEECEYSEIAPSRLIIEIGEQTPAADTNAFCRTLARLRNLGVQIAVDDVGYGHSNYRTILDCQPDYLKIDRYFVHHSDSDPARLAVVRSIRDLAAHFGATVVAEGVEREEDHAALRALGISLFQGYLFSPPAADFSTRSASACGHQLDSASPRDHRAAAHPALDRLRE
jgi:EAL domain-containing protein (putative c-di-GMP-specific phosphodiesterase class I)